MRKDLRKQVMFRAQAETLQKIDDIRRVLQPIPKVNDVLALAVDALHKELVKPTRKRAS
jgi:hypothetical protein